MSDLIQQGDAIINYYISKYKQAHDQKPMINKNTAKWAARDIVDSFGFAECKNAIDWYFSVKETGHDWIWYTNNVEKLIIARRDKEQDDYNRKIGRMKARQWLNG